MRSHKLLSGRELKISLAPFADSKNLFDEIMATIGEQHWNPDHKIDPNFIKGVLAKTLSDKKVDKALWPCLERSVYNGERITKDSFESIEAREDFLEICYEVGKDNLLPFTKNLFAKLRPKLEEMGLNLNF